MARLYGMRAFKAALRGWIPFMERGTGSKITLEDGPEHTFTLVSRWPGGEYRTHFTRRIVLGDSASKLPLKQHSVKRACRWADDVILAVLREQHSKER